MRTILANSGVLSAGSLTAQALAAVAYLLAARALRPDQFGFAVGLIGLVTLATSAADFGINAMSIRRLAEDSSDSLAFTRTLSAKITLAALLSFLWVLGCTLLYAHGLDPNEQAVVPLLAVYLVLNVISTTLAVPLMSQRRMRPVAAVSALEKLVALVVTVVALADSTTRVPALALGLSAGAVCSAALYATLLPLSMRHLQIPTVRQIVDLWHESVGFGISTLAVQLQRGDVAVVGAISGTAAAGVFAVPARLTNPLGAIPTALSAALFPHVAAIGASDRAFREAARATIVVLAFMACAFGLLFVGADQAVSGLVGPAYLASVPVLRVYLAAMMVASANQPLAVYLQATHEEQYVARTVALAALIGLGGVAAGAALAGAFGAAFGFAFQQVMIFAALAARLWGTSHVGGRLALLDQQTHADS